MISRTNGDIPQGGLFVWRAALATTAPLTRLRTLTEANGTAERTTALDMIDDNANAMAIATLP
jgi:hypothetical protein